MVLLFLVSEAPPLMLFLSIYFLEISHSSSTVRYAVLSCIVTSAVWSILNPPYNSLSLNCMSGFISGWYILWSVNVLFICNVRTLKRVQKQSGSIAHLYYWEPLPKNLSYQRIFWALDLTTNVRGIGWDHVSSKAKLPPLIHSLEEQSGTPGGRQWTNPRRGTNEDPHFLKKQLWRLLRAYFWLEIYRWIAIGHLNLLCDGSEMAVIRGVCRLALAAWDIAGPVWAIYGVLDGAHALLTIVAVGLLTSTCLRAAGEAWMYPPLFGPIKVLWSGSYRDIWGSFWHDMLKSGFLSVSRWLVPRTQPRKLVGFLGIWLCFFFSALLHAAAIYAATSDKRSTLRIFLYFFAQPGGIIIELLTSKGAAAILPARLASAYLIYAMNLLTDFLWMYGTLPLLVENVALRGILHEVAQAVHLPRRILHL